MSGLGSIGAFAGGVAQGINPYLQELLGQQQQNINDTASGLGVYALAGVPPPAPPQQGAPQGLGGGAPNVPVQPQMGGGRMPVQSPSALPAGQPMNPSGGQGLPSGGAQGQSAQSLQQPAQTPQQQPPQVSQTVQGQQQNPKQPDLSHFDGMFDFNTMARNLVRAGYPPAKIGRIIRSPAFEKMMNAEGLQQYRMLGLGIREQAVQNAEDRTANQAEQFKIKQGSLDQYRQKLLATRQSLASSMAKLGGINKDAQSQIAAINASVQRGDITPADAAKQIQAINTDREAKIGAIIKDIHNPPEMEDDGDGGGSGQDPLEEAKAAIAAGRNKQMVIERFKKLHPDLDASSLGQ